MASKVSLVSVEPSILEIRSVSSNSHLVLPCLEVEMESRSKHGNASASKKLERFLSFQPFIEERRLGVFAVRRNEGGLSGFNEALPLVEWRGGRLVELANELHATMQKVLEIHR